jgi:hypothetical protein
MVMPEIGFDELPMMPTMRLETVTKKKPKTDHQQREEQRAGQAAGQAGQDGDDQDQGQRADEHERDRHVALGALLRGGGRLPRRAGRGRSRGRRRRWSAAT